MRSTVAFLGSNISMRWSDRQFVNTSKREIELLYTKLIIYMYSHAIQNE